MTDAETLAVLHALTDDVAELNLPIEFLNEFMPNMQELITKHA